MIHGIEIETYKGHTIYYKDTDDKFICEISIEDRSKKTARKSLKDVRKEIDVFIHDNMDFKPLKTNQQTSNENDT